MKFNWLGAIGMVSVDRHLSPSIAPKRKLLAVDLTVSWARREKNPRAFKCLYVQKTIEWGVTKAVFHDFTVGRGSEA